MIIYIILSVVIASILVKQNEKKDRAIKKINIYLSLKLVINFLVAHILVLVLVEITENKSWYTMLLPAILSFVFSVIDSISLYGTIKKLRELRCERKEYYFQIIGENILLYITWFITSLLHVSGTNENNDYVFFLGYFMFWCILNFAVVHIRKYVIKSKAVSNIKLLNVINKHYIEGYKIYEYDGHIRKSANAMVDCMFGKGNIYFSDYLLDNLTEEEVEAIYLHEIGHIKKRHITIRNILLVMIMPLMYFIGVFMDEIEQVRHINIFWGIAIGMGILIGYMVFFYLYVSRRQEYAADTYAAKHINDSEVLCQALIKLNELNDVLEAKNENVVLKSHPTVIQRIKKIKEHANGGV